MAELKTQANDGDVNAFIESVDDDTKRQDSHELMDIMERLSGETARMWGKSIVGFGDYEYQTRDGKSHRWFKVGFSPRKQNMTIYVMTGFESYDDYLERLGKHTTGVSCLYVKKLDDVDRSVLEDLITESLDTIDNRTSDTGIVS